MPASANASAVDTSSCHKMSYKSTRRSRVSDSESTNRKTILSTALTGGNGAPMNHKKSAKLKVAASAPMNTRKRTRRCTAREPLRSPRTASVHNAAAISPNTYKNTRPRTTPWRCSVSTNTSIGTIKMPATRFNDEGRPGAGTIDSNRCTANCGSTTAKTAVQRAQRSLRPTWYSHCARYQSPMSPARPVKNSCGKRGLPFKSTDTAMANASTPQKSEVRVRRSIPPMPEPYRARRAEQAGCEKGAGKRGVLPEYGFSRAPSSAVGDERGSEAATDEDAGGHGQQRSGAHARA